MRYYLIFTSILFFSCEQSVNLDLPDIGKRITLNASINPDSLVTAEISNSRGVLDIRDFDAIDDANVHLYENGQFVETLVHVQGRTYQTANYKPQLNKNYRLEVERPGMITAQAETKIPDQKPELASLRLDSVVQNGRKRIVYEVEIEDPNVKNYYELIILEKKFEYVFDESINEYRQSDEGVWVNNGVKDVETFIDSGFPGEYYLIDDALINGTRFKLRVTPAFTNSGRNVLEDYEAVKVIVRDISEEFYQYKYSANLQFNTRHDPFTETVPIFTNVENGFGIFGAFQQTELEIKLK